MPQLAYGKPHLYRSCGSGGFSGAILEAAASMAALPMVLGIWSVQTLGSPAKSHSPPGNIGNRKAFGRPGNMPRLGDSAAQLPSTWFNCLRCPEEGELPVPHHSCPPPLLGSKRQVQPHPPPPSGGLYTRCEHSQLGAYPLPAERCERSQPGSHTRCNDPARG